MLVTATEISSQCCVYELVGSVVLGFFNLVQVLFTSRSGMLKVEGSAHKAVAPGLEQLQIQKGNISILTCIDPVQNTRIMIIKLMCAGCSAV